MTTAQVTLTDSQFDVLHTLSLKTGKSEDELVMEAVNKFIDEIGRKELSETGRREAIKAAVGIWKDRDDLTDEFFEQLRKESNRYANWSETDNNGK